MNATVDASALSISNARRGVWPLTIVAVVACFVALCLIFNQEVVGAYRVWVGSATYNHCFLIIPISLYMMWGRRNSVLALSPKPDFRVLFLVPLLSLAWFAASVIGVLEAQQFVLLTIFQAMFLGVLGWPVYRRLLAPFLYLYFLVPSGDYLVPTLQDFTARFAVTGLNILGIPVYSDGTVIAVPAGEFTVAEACAGLRFLIAAVAFGVFYATEIYSSPLRRLLFVGVSIVVPIIANGFRALGLIAAAEAFGSAAAIEADHITYGWIFFSLVLIALIFVGRLFSDRNRFESTDAFPPPRTQSPANLGSLLIAGVLMVGLAALGPALAIVLDAPSRQLSLQSVAPSVSLPWRRVAAGGPDWRPMVVRADREFAERFSDGNVQIDQFFALYAPHGRTSNLIRSDNRIANFEVWNVAARRIALAYLGGRAIDVNAVEIVSRNRRKLVWWFYAVDGATAATVWDAKRHQIHAYITGNACPSAFVAVSVDMAARSDAEAALNRYLSALEPLPAYLCAAKQSPT